MFTETKNQKIRKTALFLIADKRIYQSIYMHNLKRLNKDCDFKAVNADAHSKTYHRRTF